jgi:hypothetical protein
MRIAIAIVIAIGRAAVTFARICVICIDTRFIISIC